MATTITEPMAGTTINVSAGGSVQCIVWDWLSAADGSVSSTTTCTYCNAIILSACDTPDAGDTQPTAAYDLSLLDSDSVDLLAGIGLNMLNSAANHLYLPTYGVRPYHPIHKTTLTLTIANAGDSNGGVFRLWLAPLNASR